MANLQEKIDLELLKKELEEFKAEKERIKSLIGSFGGRALNRTDFIVNFLFIVALIIVFVIDTLRNIFEINIPLPEIFTLEIAVLLVSIKIVWMVYKQMKMEHFQFWILNSIEFRVNILLKELRKLDEKLSDKSNENTSP